MKTYPGLPEPRAELFLDYDTSRDTFQGQAEFRIASLHVCGNTGTYVDAPIHRFRGGADLARLPLERLAHVPAIVIDVRRCSDRGIGREVFQGVDLRGKAVLVRTDWSERWGTPAYFEPHPFLTADACDLLVAGGAHLVGIDSLNVDDRMDLARPAHTRLLGAGIPICELLTSLSAVPEGGFLHAVPIAWVGGASFPVRAYVLVP
jgi:arylformamidase